MNARLQLPIETPVGFSWIKHPLVGTLFYDELTGGVSTNFDISQFDPHRKKTNPVIYYVDGVSGSDANDGLSVGKPLRSIRTALLKSDVDIVEIFPGLITRQYAPGGPSISRSVTIRPLKGSTAPVIISGHDKLVWALTAGMTKTYQAARSSVNDVYDAKFVDDYGDYKKLTKVVDAATVETTAGSWFTDNVNVWVHPSDDRAGDDFIRAYLNVSMFQINVSADVDIYLENIQVEGGRTFSMRNSATGSPNVYAKNFTVKYCTVFDGGFEIQGARTVIFQNCCAARSENDGFNYHFTFGVIPKVVEINCTGRDNGLTSDTDNGSTMHDGGKIIRINGKYFRNIGPNVADVFAGTHSWNLGCVGYMSLATVDNQNNDFQATDGKSEMWLDRCVGYGSVNSIAAGTVDAKIYVKDSKLTTELLTGKKYSY